jgi:uncharacterized protein YecT (DUF1311 family)
MDFGRMVPARAARIALALIMPPLASCSELDTPQGKDPAACNSQTAVAALKRHVLRAAASSEGTVDIIGDLANILRYQAENADEDFRPNFRSALAGLDEISREGNLTGEGVALSVSEIVERGQSEAGESLCWARVDAALPPTATVPLAGMNEVLSNSYGWQKDSLAEGVSVEIFYTVQGGPRPAVTESDLSTSDALAIRGLGQLAQIAVAFLRPFDAMRLAEDARQRELAAAQGRVLEVSLSEARMNYAQAEAALNANWQNLAESSRKALLPQQRQWVRAREARCDLQGKQYSNDRTESEIIKLRCMTQDTVERIEMLQQY